MLRFISYLLGRPYEPCKSCETLKEQLEYERKQNQFLVLTISDLLKPKIEEKIEPQILEPLRPKGGTWARRRATLEARDREAAKVKQRSEFSGVNMESEITELEQELGVTDASQIS